METVKFDEEQFNLLVSLLATKNITNDMKFEEKIVVLNKLGLNNGQIARTLGTTKETIRVKKYKINKFKKSVKKKKKGASHEKK